MGSSTKATFRHFPCLHQAELEPKNKESSAQNKRIEISEVSFYKKSNGSKDSCFSTLKAGIMCDRQLGYFCNMYFDDGC